MIFRLPFHTAPATGMGNARNGAGAARESTGGGDAPAGKEVAFIPTGPSQAGTKKPHGIPSNVCFGRGEESKTLYVTIDTSLYRIPLKIDGYQVSAAKK